MPIRRIEIIEPTIQSDDKGSNIIISAGAFLVGALTIIIVLHSWFYR